MHTCFTFLAVNSSRYCLSICCSRDARRWRNDHLFPDMLADEEPNTLGRIGLIVPCCTYPLSMPLIQGIKTSLLSATDEGIQIPNISAWKLNIRGLSSSSVPSISISEDLGSLFEIRVVFAVPC